MKKIIFLENSGFTLIEVLIAVGILSGLILAVSFFGLDIFEFQLFLGDTFIVQNEINITLVSMGVDIRGMGPSDNGSYPMESASSGSLVFFSDIDGDGSFERIRYFVSNGSLNRGIIEPTGNPAAYFPVDEVVKELVHDVILPPIAGQPLFSYFDRNFDGSQPAMPEPIDINQVRLVRATITADKSPQDLQGRINYSATMLIRNLRNAQ